ncbi:MAG: hypothetical protein Q4G60_12865 [bacterium]|nr:hypothetical protein [bacterium]
MKKVVCFLIFAVIVCASSCTSKTGAPQNSFTFDKVYSYDKKYYALQSVEPSEAANMIKVSIYISDTDELIFDFVPARARDFWGICWESDTYNIWIQSGDIGVLCYVCQNETWILNENAERPKDILSKYD